MSFKHYEHLQDFGHYMEGGQSFNLSETEKENMFWNVEANFCSPSPKSNRMFSNKITHPQLYIFIFFFFAVSSLNIWEW